MGAASGFCAAAVGLYYLAKHRRFRLHLDAGGLTYSLDALERPRSAE